MIHESELIEKTARPETIVRTAEKLRYDHFFGLGILHQTPWIQLTDAQKLPWLPKATDYCFANYGQVVGVDV